MNTHTQSLVLSELFFEHVKGFKKENSGKYPGTESYKMAVLLNAYACLRSGHSFSFLKEALLRAKAEDKDAYNIEDYMKQKLEDFNVQNNISVKKGECIQIGRFYYHPLLQETSRPPAYFLDKETMNLVKLEVEPFFLEIKESFTVEDVLEYYYSSHRKDPLPGTAALTQVYNLTQSFDLDLILYMIDASSEDMFDNKGGAKTPAFLTEYLEQAKNMLGNRKTISKEGGLTHVTPRSK